MRACEVSTGSVSDRVSAGPDDLLKSVETRSLPLPVLTWFHALTPALFQREREIKKSAGE